MIHRHNYSFGFMLSLSLTAPISLVPEQATDKAGSRPFWVPDVKQASSSRSHGEGDGSVCCCGAREVLLTAGGKYLSVLELRSDG